MWKAKGKRRKMGSKEVQEEKMTAIVRREVREKGTLGENRMRGCHEERVSFGDG